MSEAVVIDDGVEMPKYEVRRKDDPQFVEGRRNFFEYIDLGTQEASGDKIRVQITRAKQGLVEPTGWHTHICDGQFVYMLEGWLDLAFADGTIHLEPGDSIYIPGGVPHNETGTSDTFDLIEISIPAKMHTKPCNPPPGMPV
ncbi:MAG: cupin [Alphaproteobacteria bacterium]|nr:cupin [Alphaproteobacteria bacterium]|tara:strand:- start:91 stop:516 length:426 start_codon:yes stop_codon:yes gene_type:complete